MNTVSKVGIVGGGLIGTSVALKMALLGAKVRVKDLDKSHQKVANELLGESLLESSSPAEVIVVAVPVDVLPEVIVDELCSNPKAIIIDIGSIKTKVLLEVTTLLAKKSQSEALERYVPSHPMAGREISGPESARADLFEGRAWAITPHPELDNQTLAFAKSFITSLGATPYELSPQQHDRQVAMTSHLPQILSSALAGVLREPLDLAGAGLRDMTRLAHSDSSVWLPIVEGNREEILPLLEEINESINKLINNELNRKAVLSFMEAGSVGAAKVPGKHGGIPRNYGSLSVVIPDEPGQLARLFNHCAEAQINIEDIRIEHSPGQETGLISLYVQPVDLSTLNDYLSTRGWHSTVLSKGN